MNSNSRKLILISEMCIMFLQPKCGNRVIQWSIVEPIFDSWFDWNNQKHLCRRSFSSPGSHLKYASPTPQILQAPSLQHFFKNWQSKRRNKLTASTFSMAIGFWRDSRIQLWLEKIGANEPFSGNFATCSSNVMEPKALEKYKRITQNKVFHPEFQVYGERNPEYDWIGASPDGLVDENVYGLSPTPQGVLEIKCPWYGKDAERTYPWKTLPFKYIPQAQGLMEITDRDWMHLFCWTTAGCSLFRIHRDPVYWIAMKIALSDFWWGNVQPARDRCSDSVVTDPLVELREFVPASKHEMCPYIIYESKRIAENSVLLMREINRTRVG